MSDINRPVQLLRSYEKLFGFNDMDKVAQLALAESHKVENDLHCALLYSLAINYFNNVDDGK